MREKGGLTKECLVEEGEGGRRTRVVSWGVGGSLSVPFLGVRRIPSVLRGKGWGRWEIFPLPQNLREEKCACVRVFI